ncbi:MAG TPA: cupin domain-containing protein [Gaiellaceae bacterium]|nr:cupin domain-containing protein [Gaiellaceae bacterium]
MGVAHWDDVEAHRLEKGEMAAEWQRLGDAAGTVGVGVNRVRVDPGRLSTPPHSHSVSEEIVYVLGGDGLSWQDGEVHEIRAGDCIVHVADHEEHTLRAGEQGLDVLIYGTRDKAELAWLPRSRAVRMGWPWVEGRDDDPWDVEATVPPLEVGEPSPRPAGIVNVDDVPDHAESPGEKALAEAAGSIRAGLHWSRIPAGEELAVPHCHSEEEEVFVVLEGEATLELWPSPLAAERGAAREDVPLRAGHVVARPPGTRIAHCLRAGPPGMTVLTYGTRAPNDIVYYPRSNKISWRGVGVIGRIEHVDYWDGERRRQG